MKSITGPSTYRQRLSPISTVMMPSSWDDRSYHNHHLSQFASNDSIVNPGLRVGNDFNNIPRMEYQYLHNEDHLPPPPGFIHRSRVPSTLSHQYHHHDGISYDGISYHDGISGQHNRHAFPTLSEASRNSTCQDSNSLSLNEKKNSIDHLSQFDIIYPDEDYQPIERQFGSDGNSIWCSQQQETQCVNPVRQVDRGLEQESTTSVNQFPEEHYNSLMTVIPVSGLSTGSGQQGFISTDKNEHIGKKPYSSISELNGLDEISKNLEHSVGIPYTSNKNLMKFTIVNHREDLIINQLIKNYQSIPKDSQVVQDLERLESEIQQESLSTIDTPFHKGTPYQLSPWDIQIKYQRRQDQKEFFPLKPRYAGSKPLQPDSSVQSVTDFNSNCEHRTIRPSVAVQSSDVNHHPSQTLCHTKFKKNKLRIDHRSGEVPLVGNYSNSVILTSQPSGPLLAVEGSRYDQYPLNGLVQSGQRETQNDCKVRNDVASINVMHRTTIGNTQVNTSQSGMNHVFLSSLMDPQSNSSFNSFHHSSSVRSRPTPSNIKSAKKSRNEVSPAPMSQISSVSEALIEMKHFQSTNLNKPAALSVSQGRDVPNSGPQQPKPFLSNFLQSRIVRTNNNQRSFNSQVNSKASTSLQTEYKSQKETIVSKQGRELDIAFRIPTSTESDTNVSIGISHTERNELQELYVPIVDRVSINNESNFLNEQFHDGLQNPSTSKSEGVPEFIPVTLLSNAITQDSSFNERVQGEIESHVVNETDTSIKDNDENEECEYQSIIASQSYYYSIDEEERFILHLTLLTLYKDQIKPQQIEIKHRLQELHCSVFLEKNFLKLYESFTEMYRIERSYENSSHCVTVYLRETPSWFSGWVDMRDAQNPYPLNVWLALDQYILSVLQANNNTVHGSGNGTDNMTGTSDHRGAVTETRGGRYGMAKRLKSNGPEVFRRYSLGQVCHIVQLAVHLGLLSYDGGSLMPSACCRSLVRRLFPPVTDGMEETNIQQQADLHPSKLVTAETQPTTSLAVNDSILLNGQRQLTERLKAKTETPRATTAAAADDASGGQYPVVLELDEVQKNLRTLLKDDEDEEFTPMLLSQLKFRFLHKFKRRLDPVCFGFTRLSDFLAEKCGSSCRLVREGGRQVLVDRAESSTLLKSDCQELSNEDEGSLIETNNNNSVPTESEVSNKKVETIIASKVTGPIDLSTTTNSSPWLSSSTADPSADRTTRGLLAVIAKHNRFHSNLSFSFWQFCTESKKIKLQQEAALVTDVSESTHSVEQGSLSTHVAYEYLTNHHSYDSESFLMFCPAARFADLLFASVLRPAAIHTPYVQSVEPHSESGMVRSSNVLIESPTIKTLSVTKVEDLPDAEIHNITNRYHDSATVISGLSTTSMGYQMCRLQWFTRRPLVERQLGYRVPLIDEDVEALQEIYFSVLPPRLPVIPSSDSTRAPRPSKLRRQITAQISQLRREVFPHSVTY